MIEPPFYDLPAPRLEDWGYGMTVCIAAVTSEGLIVTISDKKLSTGMFSSDASVIKSRSFHKEWLALIAGDDVSPALSIMRKASRNFTKLRENRLDNAIQSFKDAYKQEISEYAADVVLSRFNLTMAQFLDKGAKKFTSDVFGTLFDQIANINLKCKFLVAGFDQWKAPHIFSVANPGTVETYDLPGFWSIGTGSQSALGMLFFRGQNKKLPLAATVYNCLEAKFMSESARDVGKTTYLFVQKFGCDTCRISTTLEPRVRDVWERKGQPRVPKGALKMIEESNITCSNEGGEGQ